MFSPAFVPQCKYIPWITLNLMLGVTPSVGAVSIPPRPGPGPCLFCHVLMGPLLKGSVQWCLYPSLGMVILMGSMWVILGLCPSYTPVHSPTVKVSQLLAPCYYGLSVGHHSANHHVCCRLTGATCHSPLILGPALALCQAWTC